MVWNLQKTAEPHFHTAKFYIKQFHWRIEEIYKFIHSKLGLAISCFLFLQCPSGRISNTNIFRQTNLVLILQKHHINEHSGIFTSLDIHPPGTKLGPIIVFCLERKLPFFYLFPSPLSCFLNRAKILEESHSNWWRLTSLMGTSDWEIRLWQAIYYMPYWKLWWDYYELYKLPTWKKNR